MTLERKTFLGFFWSMGQEFGVKVVSFIVQIVLARFLLPSDFGLIAIIMVFVAVGNSLSDSGLTSSLIRTVNANEKDYSTVFFANIAFSMLVYFIAFLGCPLIASFYNEAEITTLIRVLALSFVIKAFTGVQATILRKELQFKRQMLLRLPSVAFSGIAGIILAYMGYGVWSLVWMNLVESIFFAVAHWIGSSWYPSFIFDRKKLVEHLNFGYKLTLAGVLNAVFTNAYSLIIGKWYSPIQLGFYNRADSFQSFPVRTIVSALKSVAYPVLSQIQDDDARLVESYKKMMIQVVFFITPLMVILVIVAEPLFRFLLTEKWLPAVPYFQLLCISSILYPLQEYNIQILDVKGRSDIYLKIELIKKIIMIVIIFLVIPYGIEGIIYAQIFQSLVFFLVSAFYTSKFVNFTVLEQIKNIYPAMILALAIGSGVKYLDHLLQMLNTNDSIRILTNVLCFSVLYIGLGILLKLSALSELYRIKNLAKNIM